MAGQSSRRSFLVKVTGAAVVLPSAIAALGNNSRTTAAELATGEAYWEMVRRQFPFREAKVPMNAANLCPSPRVVAEKVSELTRDIDIDCSFNNRAKFSDLLETSRRKVARLT